MNQTLRMKVVVAGLLLLAGILSFALIGSVLTSPKAYKKTITALDEKEDTVLKLTAAAAGTSALITLIPDDIGTPIAEQVAEVGGYALLVICAIYAEKMLLTITGFATFKILIPIACLIGIICVFRPNDIWKRLGLKLALFGLAICIVIPASIKVSELIESTYEESIETTIESAEVAPEELGTVTEITQEVKNVINKFIKAVAVLIITSCVIPILVFLAFIWIANLILGANIRLGGFGGKRRKPQEPEVEWLE